MTDRNDAASHYLEEARRQLRGHKRMAEGAMSQLKDEDFFVTLDPEANSVNGNWSVRRFLALISSIARLPRPPFV